MPLVARRQCVGWGWRQFTIESSPLKTRTMLLVFLSQMKNEPSSEPATMYWPLLKQKSPSFFFSSTNKSFRSTVTLAIESAHENGKSHVRKIRMNDEKNTNAKPSKEVGLLDVGGGVAVTTESGIVIVGVVSPEFFLFRDLTAGPPPASRPVINLLLAIWVNNQNNEICEILARTSSMS